MLESILEEEIGPRPTYRKRPVGNQERANTLHDAITLLLNRQLLNGQLDHEHALAIRTDAEAHGGYVSRTRQSLGPVNTPNMVDRKASLRMTKALGL